MAKQGKSWPEVELGDVVEKITNGAGLPQVDQQSNGMFPITRIETISFEEIDLRRVKYVKASTSDVEKYGLKFGDILFSHINSDKHLGKTAINKTTETIIHGINLLLIRTNHLCDSSYLNYYFKWYRLRGGFVEIAQRAVNQSSINQKKLKQIKVPLPPLPEQKRIVAKLDTLFAHLDQLRSRLDKIPALVKQFRQAVLTQAVTGKLTEEWRKKHVDISSRNLRHSDRLPFEIPGSWRYVQLCEVCEKFTYGTSAKSQESGRVPVLRMGNIQNGRIDWSDLKYTSAKQEIEKYALRDGDVLFNRTNSPELVGKSSVYEGKKPAIYAGYLIKIWNNKELNSHFLNVILNSPYGRDWSWRSKSDGVSQSNINAKKLAAFEIPLPPIAEQKEIIRAVESLADMSNRIEILTQSLNEKLGQMMQSILSRAFQGKLLDQQSKVYREKMDNFILAAEP